MNELLASLDFTIQENFSISTFIINIIITSILLYIIAKVYVRFGNSISNRGQLARVLVLVGVTTFIIISIVKSSLALSLGLVGALSIIRFRTAIKEPEELAFFFISISIGLGLGANQLAPTLIGFIMLVAIIILLNREKMAKTLTQNIIISMSPTGLDKNDVLEKISSILELNSNQVELKRLSQTEENISINFLVNVQGLDSLQKITKEFNLYNKNMDVTFIDSNIV